MKKNYYQLDSETLFLLRSRAILDLEDYAPDRTFHSKEDLESYINSISETQKYFNQLKKELGCKEGARRRVPLKIKNVWSVVCNTLNHKFCAKRADNCINSLSSVVDVFGFSTPLELRDAVFTNGFELSLTGTVSIEEQDTIAKAFGFKDWLDMTASEDVKYRISESVLMRAYGKHKCASALTLSTLNAISQYICGCNWTEFDNPKKRIEVEESILSKLIKTQKVKPITIKNGDTIKIANEDGTFSLYRYNNHTFEICNDICA